MSDEAKIIDIGRARDEAEQQPTYKLKPLGTWVQIEPLAPSEDMLKSAGGIWIPGMGAKRKQDEAAEKEHTKFKMTHARVLAVGPDVTRVHVGDVIRFVGHPQSPMTGEPVQECLVNTSDGPKYLDCLPESLIYCVLEPVGASATPRVLQ